MNCRVTRPEVRQLGVHNGRESARSARLKRANSGQSAAQQCVGYSITSSARAITVCGNLIPSALAVLRLTANSNLVGS